MTPKQKFIFRLGLTIIFSVILPVTYLAIRFELFTKADTFRLSLWGVLLLVYLITIIGFLVKIYLTGMKTRYSYFKQILQGGIKIVLPLLVVIVILNTLKHNIDILIEFLYVVLPCVVGAIVVNPLPKWAFENNVEGLGEIIAKVYNKVKE